MRLASILLSLFTAQAAAAQGLTIFAAASLKEALDEAVAVWSASTGETATLSYAGSSALARQIEAGAPADLFVSASVEWMDALEEGGRIAEETRTDLLGNVLVLIASAEAEPIAIADLPQALGDERLAMALYDSVPAGVYGREALTSLGIWDAVANRVAQADNVRGALALVATGEAPYGIVYATDAAAEPRVRVAATFPADSHSAIIYPAAAVAEGDVEGARDLLDFLQGAEADVIFLRHGFAPR